MKVLCLLQPPNFLMNNQELVSALLNKKSMSHDNLLIDLLNDQQPHCEKCDSMKFYRNRKKQAFNCGCGRTIYYPIANTFLKNTKIRLDVWQLIIKMKSKNPNITIVDLAAHINVTYSSVWRMVKLLTPYL